MHIYIYIYIHIYIHTYIHACMHTYIHTYMDGGTQPTITPLINGPPNEDHL